MPQRNKCVFVPTRGDFNYCKPMEDLVEPSGTARGFIHVVTISTRSLASSYRGVCYKRDPRDRGSMLNHCPFCDEKIDQLHDLKNVKPKKLK